MNKIVLFLGAGASKVFGYPLTTEIFPMILEGIENKMIFKNDSGKNDEEELAHLDYFLRKLFPGLNKVATDKLPQITEILSLLDHLIIHGNTPWFENSNRTVAYYKRLLERAIIDVLTPKDDRPIELKNTCEWIYRNHKNSYFTIISTNYDLSIELKLFDLIKDREKINKNIDYGFNWRYPSDGNIASTPENPILSIYKLHGSMNWLKCDLCDYVYINSYGSIYKQAFRKKIDDYNTCHCGHGPLNCLIVTPSTERDVRDSSIVTIWKNALEKLRIADEWIIIGYSLPPEDLNIKSMLIRAFNGREKLSPPKITVVQKGEEAKNRYEILFNNISYISGGLEEFIRDKS